MIKQLALVIILVLGITGAVFVIQNSTLLKSFAYDVADFVYAFHHKEGDPEFNPNLDTNKDGIINVVDILKDRYAQEATKSGEASGSANLRESSNSAQEASGSGTQ